jgi:transcriptional regulator with XRE-family HTH domain
MMHVNKREGANFFKQKLKEKKMPRNQLTALTGLSNTYICNVEEGKTVNVERERLIALAFSLDLTLFETDDFLNRFDRVRLNENDISIYLNLSTKIQPSKILHPLRSVLNYELLLLGTESTPGPKKVVMNHLTAILFPEGYRSYKIETDHDKHPLFIPLVEAIGKKRKQTLTTQLSDYRMDHYISQDRLFFYLKECNDPVDKNFRLKNLESVILFLNNYENFNYYITRMGHTFEFVAKYSKDNSKIEKIFFEGSKEPDSFGRFGRQLSGFCTSNEALIDQFKLDLEIQHNHVLEEYLNRDKLVSYLESFLVE